MEIEIPEFSLVLLIGASGSGKTSFARKHFNSTEIVSLDDYRATIADYPDKLEATEDAYQVLHQIVAARLKRGLLAVVDEDHLKLEARRPLLEIVRKYYCKAIAVVFLLPEEELLRRDRERKDKGVGEFIIEHQCEQLESSLRSLKNDFHKVYYLRSQEEIDKVEHIKIVRPKQNQKSLKGPFDIIGDVHGCYEELVALLKKLEYEIQEVKETEENYGFAVHHPQGRKVVFVGDLVDRGPASPAVLKLVMSMVNAGIAFCVPGNHDDKLMRKLKGRNVQLRHGLEVTMAQMERESRHFAEKVKQFVYSLPSHLVLDEGNLIVAHAGLKEKMHGRATKSVREYCLYGETTGKLDALGLPERINWAAKYSGKALVVYGHTPVVEPRWENNTVDIDTGCVFGGSLTALRYPEKEVVAVDALKKYAEPSRPIQFQKILK